MKISEEYASQFLNGQVLRDLAGLDKDVPVQLKRVVKQEIFSPFTNRKEVQNVLSFIGKEKVLILKKTNALSLAAIAGDDTTKWHGVWVAMYATLVHSPDGMVPGVRFRELSSPPPGKGKPAREKQPPPAAQQQPVEDAAEESKDARPPGAKTGSLEIDMDEFWFGGETPYSFSDVMLALAADDVDPDDPEFRAEASAWLQLQGYEDHEIPQPAPPGGAEDDTPPHGEPFVPDHDEPDFWPSEKGEEDGK